MSDYRCPSTFVTFGVRVSLEMLGARLEVRRECGVALTAFERCIQNLPRLPLEVWDMIVKELQQSTYEEKLEWWKTANRCCKNLCECGDNNESGDGWKEHYDRVCPLKTKIARFHCDRSLNSKKGFKEDFGLELKFPVFWDIDDEKRKDLIIHAYIVLPPIIESVVDYSGDGGRISPVFSILSAIFIDPIPTPTAEQIELFEAALETLHLQPLEYKPQEVHEVLEMRERLEVPASSSTGWPKLLVLTTGHLY